MNRNQTNEYLKVKNERVHDKQDVKQTTAHYFENLYAKKTNAMTPSP